jgi:hypothetical protein
MSVGTAAERAVPAVRTRERRRRSWRRLLVGTGALASALAV